MVRLEELHQVTGAGGHDDDEHEQQQQQQLVVTVNGDGEKKKEKEKEKEKEKHEVVPQLRFPAGFRFVPSDLELMDVFLRGKIDGRKLPLELVFFNVPILNWEPQKLVEARKAYGVDRWYFFTKREPSTTNKAGEPRRKLHDVDAAWKATGPLNKVYRGLAATGDLVGTKKLLTYYVGGDVGDWSMHEYVLDGMEYQLDEFVLCTIQEKMHGNGKRRKRPAKELLPKRNNKKAAATATASTSQQQQPEQEETTAYYCDPLPPPLLEQGKYYPYHLAALQEEEEEEEYPMDQPLLPLLEHGQCYHPQASSQEEHAMGFGVDPLGGGYLDGDHHHDYHLVDVATNEEDTLAYDGSGVLEPPPLMMPQDQHDSQALQLLEEMDLEYYKQSFAMDPVYAQDDDQGQQSMWGQTQISSQVNEYNWHDDHHLYQQPSMPLEDIFGCLGSLETSPGSVLQGPEPLSYEKAPSGDDATGDLVLLVNGNNGGKDAARMALHVCQHGGEVRQKSMDVVSFNYHGGGDNLVVRCCLLCVKSCVPCNTGEF